MSLARPMISASSGPTRNDTMVEQWGHLRHRFFQWRRYVHLCRELMSLSDEELRDIGLSRTEVNIAASKVFWLP